jgi:hypothetical protein
MKKKWMLLMFVATGLAITSCKKEENKDTNSNNDGGGNTGPSKLEIAIGNYNGTTQSVIDGQTTSAAARYSITSSTDGKLTITDLDLTTMVLTTDVPTVTGAIVKANIPSQQVNPFGISKNTYVGYGMHLTVDTDNKGVKIEYTETSPSNFVISTSFSGSKQ